jgi:hypothetical protein
VNELVRMNICGLFLRGFLENYNDSLNSEPIFSILYGRTFRFPKTTSLYRVLKGYFRGIFRMIIAPANATKSKFNNALVLDHFNNRWDPAIRIKYVESLDREKNELALVNKMDLPIFVSYPRRIFLCITLIAVFPLVIILFIYKKGLKANAALIPVITYEYVGLSRIIKDNNISRLYYFNSYEFDSNLVATLLMDDGVHVIKIPSPNPLSYHYKNILCSELVLSSRYQLEELESGNLSTNGSIKFWVPENSSLYLSKYLITRKTKKVIGYYSSANWLRVKLGHSEILPRMRNDEELLMKLGETVNITGSKLRVFLHPREKIHAQKDEVKDYYSRLLSDSAYDIDSFSLDDVSACKLNEVDVAITPLTTLFFERVFCGFKSFMILDSADVFPLKSSPLANICLTNMNDLEKRIEESLEISNDEFFEKYNLNDYYLNGIDSKKLQTIFNL